MKTGNRRNTVFSCSNSTFFLREISKTRQFTFWQLDCDAPNGAFGKDFEKITYITHGKLDNKQLSFQQDYYWRYRLQRELNIYLGGHLASEWKRNYRDSNCFPLKNIVRGNFIELLQVDHLKSSKANVCHSGLWAEQFTK